MIILRTFEGKPYPMVHFLTDDFGNEKHVVLTPFEPNEYEQVKISHDTYFHLFDMERTIRVEANHE